MEKVKHQIRKTAAFLAAVCVMFSLFQGMVFVAAYASGYEDLSALDQYAYSGNDLGATYTKSSTTFKVWAPTASKVQLKRYKTGSDSEEGAGVIEIKDMVKQDQGVWSVTVSGDLANTYYTYLVTNNGVTKETVDIYAKSTGVNGLRGMVIDLDSTDPIGWENDSRVECENQTDSIIWEIHVRDFSSSSDSGMTNKGKFLAFTETGTTVNGDGVHKTGIDYLEDLGVTHVHLLPVYDYGSVDETKLSTDQFNWGYDPLNYNTPEGSYSTNPYDGNVRVNEFKQMVQSLHKKKIGVVMDVVYNHTYAGSSGINDWFNFTVPGYYYRQTSTGALSDASGCGNETASDRAMYQKFMIDSVVYWATEYHIDGFRFDLMGIHDVDTMNKIRAALDEIDPDILIYGEPWTAAATTSPKKTAVQGNMSLVSEEVAAFNDKVRDAIKGSCFNAADQGFIQGAGGFETALKGGIQASSTTMSGSSKWSKQPSQTVTYTSAHDNYTLYDKLVKSVKGGYGYTTRYEDLVAMNKMAGGIILTSQGMSFFQAGEEFARSKNGNDNSYNASTEVNQLKWYNTITYQDIVSYYKGLIQIRKAYAPFRDPSNTSNDTIYFSWGDNCPANVVAFTMYNKLSTEGWNFAAVIHNANGSSKTVNLQTYDGVTLPSQWVIVADGTNAGIQSLGITGSTVEVPANSTVVLIDKTSFDNTVISEKCTVKVNHIIENTGTVYQTETLKGNEGASYTTSPLAELTEEGYTVSRVSGSTSATFTKAGATVNYYYEIDDSKIGKVVLKYVDQSGKQLIGSETYTGLIGKSYNYAPKEINGYTCTSANASGVFSADIKTYTFVYEEITLKRVYFDNASNWSNVNAYIWKKGTNTNVKSWPGAAMSVDEDGDYYVDVDVADGFNCIIFNNGSVKTNDLDIPMTKSNLYHYASDTWTEYKIPTPVIIEAGWKPDDNGMKYLRADGSYVTNEWEEIDGNRYHFDANGYMQTGWFKEGSDYYYLGSNGVMARDEWVENEKYYIGSDGKWVKGKTKITEGWKQDRKGWWYQNADGTYPKNAWKQIGGKWYHFDASGYMQTGWYQEGNAYYYLKSNGAMAADEWVENGKYFVGSDGKWVPGKTTLSGTWKKDSKGYWYRNSDGTYPKNTWKQIDGKWYHFDANGYMQTGWYQEGNVWYYLKSSGAMAVSEWVDNGQYYIDSKGHWVQNL